MILGIVIDVVLKKWLAIEHQNFNAEGYLRLANGKVQYFVSNECDNIKLLKLCDITQHNYDVFADGYYLGYMSINNVILIPYKHLEFNDIK